ncbi:hypothetical protein M9H77_30096 [Catharanthus roseus]|uniref:Uncharacterized protein n=1 Tax=Catharanthus roseus TaxID=4058 RepID=A0ACB9ZX42_CATRO|nr:hypothetical protein M9H77_30096 [Catharanthus roseus]
MKTPFRWDDRLVESQEGLEIKVGIRADLVGAPGSIAWFYVNGECLAGIDYEMPELVSDDLVIGSGLCSWCPTVVFHVLLNLGVEVALMCLDLVRLPSCARTPHIGSTLKVHSFKDLHLIHTNRKIFLEMIIRSFLEPYAMSDHLIFRKKFLAKKKCTCNSLRVSLTTFLNGDLDKEVYMEQPEGFGLVGN